MLALFLSLSTVAPERSLGPSSSRSESPADEAVVAPASLPKPGPETMLIYEILLGNRTLSPSTVAHGEEGDPLLPVGEIARLLELDIRINPAEGTAAGRLGKDERSLVIDLAQRFAAVGSNRLSIHDSQGAASDSELYIAASLLARLLPIDIAVDADNFVVTLTAREPLPVEERAKRGERRDGFSALADVEGADQPLMIDAPFGWLDIPSSDIALHLGTSDGGRTLSRRLELRSAGDLAKASFSGFFGTDERGRPAAATVRLDRHSAARDLLGPLRASYAGIGDVYTPALSLGARSQGGSGLAFSTAGLSDTSVFQRITLRGELPLGYDAELYVNDVLRGSQDQARAGRYEFPDVPLTRGRNVIRLVTYGPRGQRDEEIRVINVGGGQLARGVFELAGGLVRQDRPMIRFGDDPSTLVEEDPQFGKRRAVLAAGYGLSERLTLVGGAALFADATGQRRRQFTAGVRTGFMGVAIEADVARETGSGGAGRATAIGLAGRVLGVAYTARHRRYSGHFGDEISDLFDPGLPLRRTTDLQADASPKIAGLGIVPLSGRVRFGRFADGSGQRLIQARTSLRLLGSFVSLSTRHLREQDVQRAARDDWTLDVAATRRVGSDLSLRASAAFDLLRARPLQSLDMTADYRLKPRLGFRAGVAKGFDTVGDLDGRLGVNMGLGPVEIAMSGGYSTGRRNWNFGLQVNVGALFDPGRKAMRLARPGVASGASVSLNAFRDTDGDGRRGPGEPGLAGIRTMASGDPVATDERGYTLLTGLGDSQRALFRMDTADVEDLFLEAPASRMMVPARPGKVVRVDFPVQTLGELIVSLAVRRADGSEIGLSAVDFLLLGEDGSRTSARTEFDGTAVFPSLKAGRYAIELDRQQAERLGMRLAQPMVIEVSSEGGAIRAEGLILIERARP